MSNRTKIAAVLALACSIQACGGWYLRGEGPNKFPFETAYVNSANAPKVSTAVRTALVNRGEAVFEAEALIEDRRRIIDLSATGAGEIAAEQRLQHEHQRIALGPPDALGQNVGADADLLN